jgi:hypothetical protein
LIGIFFFGLPILDRIELPIAAIILCLYSDNSINSAPANSSTPATVADSLTPWSSAGSPAFVVPGKLLHLPLQATYLTRWCHPRTSRLILFIAGSSSQSSPGTSLTSCHEF